MSDEYTLLRGRRIPLDTRTDYERSLERQLDKYREALERIAAGDEGPFAANAAREVLG